ncbi:HalOD1 output domain-containing protein [Halalkaliarchaeum desulfuricum]|nr:HalOD1 output domain-containing protein [Halalkaliarchaeum desulfuricum]
MSTYSRSVSDVPGDSISVAVSVLLEEVSGQDISGQRPLSDSIDPEGLDALFDPPGGEPLGVVVTFTHDGYRIRVEDGERIEISEID